MKQLFEKIVTLSHELTPSTPGYRGHSHIKITPATSIQSGDSCNSLSISLPNHIGTHVDTPRHFFDDGKSIDEYAPEDWTFLNPKLINIPCENNEIISIEKITNLVQSCNQTDILLLQTGFEKHRKSEVYWRCNPTIGEGVAQCLLEMLPHLKAICLDTISLTGYNHRELGRQVHKEFLSKDIRIFEDVRLSNLSGDFTLDFVTTFPLPIAGADGAPCGIYAFIR